MPESTETVDTLEEPEEEVVEEVDLSEAWREECTTKGRIWQEDSCSKECINGQSFKYDMNSETCLEEPKKKCDPGSEYDFETKRCKLEYLDYTRNECHEAGLRYLRKNLKKGRPLNGCYSKCKSKKRVYDADQKKCSFNSEEDKKLEE